jgi:hypothetical protein
MRILLHAAMEIVVRSQTRRPPGAFKEFLKESRIKGLDIRIHD